MAFFFFLFSTAISVDYELGFNIARSQFERAQFVADSLFDDLNPENFRSAADFIVSAHRGQRKNTALAKMRLRVGSIECFVSSKAEFSMLEKLCGFPVWNRRSFGLRETSFRVFDAAVYAADLNCRQICLASKVLKKITIIALISMEAETAAGRVVDEYRELFRLAKIKRDKYLLKKRICNASILFIFGYVVIFHKGLLFSLIPVCAKITAVSVSMICSSLISLYFAWSICKLVS